MSTAMAVNNKTGPSITLRPVQIKELPSSTKVKSKSISAVTAPYSTKQSHNSTSSAAIVIPAANAARNPLP